MKIDIEVMMKTSPGSGANRRSKYMTGESHNRSLHSRDDFTQEPTLTKQSFHGFQVNS